MISAFGDRPASIVTIDRSGNNGYNTDKTANKSNFSNTNYNNRFNGLHVNHDYGYGLIDAKAAVNLAETWQLRSGTGKNEAAIKANEKVQILALA